MFVYWLLYSVRMILAPRFMEENSKRVTNLVRLNFPEVQAELSQDSRELDELYDDLQADYELLMSLLPDAGTVSTMEESLAKLSFRLDRVKYSVFAKLPTGLKGYCQRRTLSDMAEMVQHLSSALGESSC